MTIDSDWLRIAKQGCPHAFTANHPFPGGTVFIDGQIRLMKPDYIKTWDLFVRKQFIEVIDRWFATGAHMVVLGFDDYENVPEAKHMTQRKRSHHVPALSFEAHSDLPPIIPEQWSSAMRNRAFKTKVVSLVCAYVRDAYKTRSAGTVVIDHARRVEVLGGEADLPPELASETPPGRGECDIKGFMYMRDHTGELSKSQLTLASTDGDFLPIALLQLERVQAAAAPIVLYRMRTSLPTDTDADKRQRFEYVHVQPVYAWLRSQMARVPRPAAHFAAMVACTGCDFAQNLPLIGPTRLWKIRNRFDKFDTSCPTGVLAVLYTAYLYLFENKTTLSSSNTRIPDAVLHPENAADPAGLEQLSALFGDLMQAVARNTRVADRSKKALWTSSRAVAHAQNCHWTTLYWMLLHDCPDPLSGGFGFHRVGTSVEFCADAAAPPGAKPAKPGQPRPKRQPRAGAKRKSTDSVRPSAEMT